MKDAKKGKAGSKVATPPADGVPEVKSGGEAKAPKEAIKHLKVRSLQKTLDKEIEKKFTKEETDKLMKKEEVKKAEEDKKTAEETEKDDKVIGESKT